MSAYDKRGAVEFDGVFARDWSRPGDRWVHRTSFRITLEGAMETGRLNAWRKKTGREWNAIVWTP